MKTVIITIYILLSLSYCIYWFKKGRNEGIFRLAVVLFVPLLGLAYFFISWLFNKLYKNSDSDVDAKLTSLKQKKVFYNYKKPDIYKETNIIPVQEALIMNNSNIKRQLLIDVLKKDAMEYIKFLKEALNDNDTETSHYAAAAVTEVKRKLNITIQELSEKYEANKHKIGKMLSNIDEDQNDSESDCLKDILISYADVLEKYLGSGLLDEQSYIKYNKNYYNVLKELLLIHTSGEKYFVDMINCCLEIKNYDEAKAYCNKFHHSHNNTEKTYIMELKVFYHNKDYENFHKTLIHMKRSHIRLSNSALNIVRFWSQKPEVAK